MKYEEFLQRKRHTSVDYGITPIVYNDSLFDYQKPVKLYDWIYHNFLPEGGKVLDTHLGSGSNRISAHKRGNIDFTAAEIDKEYFDAQEKRYREFISQMTLDLK